MANQWSNMHNQNQQNTFKGEYLKAINMYACELVKHNWACVCALTEQGWTALRWTVASYVNQYEQKQNMDT